MFVVIAKHPSEELTLVRPTGLLRRGAEVTGLFGNGQLTVVGDAKFGSWDRVEVVLVRRVHLVDVLPLCIAPPVRRVLHERLVEAVAVDLRNEAESTIKGLRVGEAGDRKGIIFW